MVFPKMRPSEEYVRQRRRNREIPRNVRRRLEYPINEAAPAAPEVAQPGLYVPDPLNFPRPLAGNRPGNGHHNLHQVHHGYNGNPAPCQPNVPLSPCTPNNFSFPHAQNTSNITPLTQNSDLSENNNVPDLEK